MLIISCSSHKTDRGIYIQNSVFQLNEVEKEFINYQDIQKVYVRFFEAGFNEKTKKPYISNLLTINEKPTKAYRIVPIIIIKDKIFQYVNNENIEELSNFICQKITQIISDHKLTDIIEIQVDCDWELNSKIKYFKLLENIRKNMLFEDKILTATLKLQKINFIKISDVLPIDRCMLKCYNTGNIRDYNLKNSIFDFKESEKYIEIIKNFPIPVDLSIPVFSRAIVFKIQKFKMLIDNITEEEIKSSNKFEILQSHYFKAKENLELKGCLIQKDEIIRAEATDFSQLLKFAEKTKLNNANYTVTLFYLNDAITNDKNSIAEKIFNSFE